MILYLVRHATPNLSSYSGFPGPPLGDSGKIEAQNITSYLTDKNIQQIFSSDYVRVRQTLAPFVEKNPSIEKQIIKALRERENEIETHNSLVSRVQEWFKVSLPNLKTNTAIFSHCGPINMLLNYLDPKQKILQYPFQCPHLCLTPKGGIWKLHLQKQQLEKGELLSINFEQ